MTANGFPVNEQLAAVVFAQWSSSIDCPPFKLHVTQCIWVIVDKFQAQKIVI